MCCFIVGGGGWVHVVSLYIITTKVIFLDGQLPVSIWLPVIQLYFCLYSSNIFLIFFTHTHFGKPTVECMSMAFNKYNVTLFSWAELCISFFLCSEKNKLQSLVTKQCDLCKNWQPYSEKLQTNPSWVFHTVAMYAGIWFYFSRIIQASWQLFAPCCI